MTTTTTTIMVGIQLRVAPEGRLMIMMGVKVGVDTMVRTYMGYQMESGRFREQPRTSWAI